MDDKEKTNGSTPRKVLDKRSNPIQITAEFLISNQQFPWEQKKKTKSKTKNEVASREELGLPMQFGKAKTNHMTKKWNRYIKSFQTSQITTDFKPVRCFQIFRQ